MDEFELIARYFSRAGGNGVVTGVGDDGAVLAPGQGRDLVTVIDTLVAGTHFPATIDAADLGYRAVAVNLSDIAAMGARPRWATLALTLQTADAAWLQGFADGLYAAADEAGLALVGGDTTAGDCLVVSVQITGDVETGGALLRSGAQAGDTLYVTGTVGDAAAGLELLQSGSADGYLETRFLRPTPRLACGRELVGRASGAIDLSDGLYADLGKLLAASRVGADLDLGKLPMSAELRSHCDAERQLQLALAGGDDYELLFTAAETLPDVVGGVPVTAIGTVTRRPGIECYRDGELVHFADGGYRHFA